ncbi:rhomboid family intramembrane serine protease [Tengunoibacter tsumagoiensis]|uniref:Peptidase S54 rhomboid domain-containing protein n=1 Tax=Tengunoibacter tsumagoiensis TaxID=2014871 RepID=A0A402A4P2_9CHLR|nr:rhomboid family intramembrane serine protease [Tengunoibacter tsumagoiensis]GCE13975.1 hypothetical protein KTT_38340 [Tengunoibacter tsumagoiensis]
MYEGRVETKQSAENEQRIHAELSYRTALHHYRQKRGVDQQCWVTWLIVGITVIIWCITATQAAIVGGFRDWRAVLYDIGNNAISVQNDQSLSQVLIAAGAKADNLIKQGEYWRFLTPIFLHANALHLLLNMVNLLVLGIILERIMGHLRFLFVYTITGIVSMIVSFVFAPDILSVGASGAIFGLVGAYSLFIVMHRRAFPRGGLFALLWLIVVIGINLGSGGIFPNVDNYAHIGGLISGCVLGAWFMPLYRTSSVADQTLVDVHSLTYRWPLAVLTILGTLLFAIIACFLI